MSRDGVPVQFGDRKHLLSALTRQAHETGKHVTITHANIASLLDSVPSLTTPLEHMNRLLLLIGKRQQRADGLVKFKAGADYPLAFAHDGNEFTYFLRVLVIQGLVEPVSPRLDGLAAVEDGVRLTPTGWQEVRRLLKTERNSDQAFVAMSFAKDLHEAWELGFKPALESTGFHPYRVDQDQYNDKIDDRIVAEIRRSGLLVADFTGHRGGVYFEAGFAMGLGIPVIWTCRETDIEQAHFDTRQYNHVVWTDPTDLEPKLALRIGATIPGRPIRSETSP